MQEKVVMLVVDDVEVNRASLKAMFGQEYEILEAENGEVALDILRSRSVDVVILDVRMPVLDGGSVLSQMKADSSLRDIPVIVKTSMDEYREIEMLKKGADDFIFAPCEPAILINRVRNIVEKYVFKKRMFQKKIEDEQHANRVRESFIMRISNEIRKDAQEILALCESDFAGDVSHESSSEKLECEETRKKISGHASHLLSLVESVLDGTRIGAETFVAQAVPFQLQEVIDEVTREYNEKYQAKGIRLEVEKCGVSYENLVGDCKHFKLLWRRLLKRAYDNSVAGDTVITGCRQRKVGKRKVEIELRVRGGIKAQDTYPVSKSLVELLRGSMSIWHEGENSNGIVVTVPFDIGKQPVIQRRSLGSMHVLVIDDNELTRNYHTSMLMRLGVDWEIATNGADAVHKLKRADAQGRGYDMCFVNWYMLGGADIVREIRGYHTPEQMMIICSTNEKSKIEEKMKEAGVDYVAERPVHQAKLYQFLTDICNGVIEKESKESE